MTVGKHIHRLRKYKYPKTGTEVYFCTLPDCTFKVEHQFMLGKENICNICGEPFFMTLQTLKLKSPHCANCGRVEVKDADGKKRYITKVNSKVLDSVAASASDSLKDRLERATAIPEDDVL